MTPVFLVPESTITAAGESEPVALPGSQALLLTLGITHVIEQESLDVLILKSADGSAWTKIAAFPQKFYTGVSSLLVDFTQHPEARFLRAQWKVNRWGRGEKTPSFKFYLVAEPAR